MGANLLRPALRVARYALVEVVVVADALDPDLVSGPDAGRRVQTALGDAHVLAPRHLPEQRRAALGTEPSPRVPDAVRAVDPAESPLLGEVEIVEQRLRRRPRMPRPAPALGAVTQHHIAQRPSHLERHSSADATPRTHGRNRNGG